MQHLVDGRACVVMLVDCHEVEPHSCVIRRIPKHGENAVNEVDESALPRVGDKVLGLAHVCRINQFRLSAVRFGWNSRRNKLGLGTSLRGLKI